MSTTCSTDSLTFTCLRSCSPHAPVLSVPEPFRRGARHLLVRFRRPGRGARPAHPGAGPLPGGLPPDAGLGLANASPHCRRAGGGGGHGAVPVGSESSLKYWFINPVVTYRWVLARTSAPPPDQGNNRLFKFKMYGTCMARSGSELKIVRQEYTNVYRQRLCSLGHGSHSRHVKYTSERLGGIAEEASLGGAKLKVGSASQV